MPGDQSPRSIGRDHCRCGSASLRRRRPRAAGRERGGAAPEPAPSATAPAPGIRRDRRDGVGSARETRPSGLMRGSGPGQAEAGAPAFWRHRAKRLNDCRIEPSAGECGVQRGELCRPVGGRVEVLQGAAAAPAEMPARRGAAPLAGGEQLDSAAFTAAAAALAEHRSDPVASGGERQIDRLAAPSRDPVARGADSLDDQFDRLASQSPPSSNAASGRLQPPGLPPMGKSRAIAPYNLRTIGGGSSLGGGECRRRDVSLGVLGWDRALCRVDGLLRLQRLERAVARKGKQGARGLPAPGHRLREPSRRRLATDVCRKSPYRSLA